jgi:CRP-like cAMP-binding protein
MNVETLNQMGTIRHYAQGDIIFLEGDPGDEMHIVLRGQVDIIISSPRGPKTVARLGPGSFFGEMSILENAPRSGSARTTIDTFTVAIHRDRFMAFIQAEPEIAFRIMQCLSQRIRHQNDIVYEKKARCLTQLDIDDVDEIFSTQLPGKNPS